MTASWQVRRFGAEAAELLAALHGGCFVEAWSALSMTEFLSAPGSVALLAAAATGEAAPAGLALARAAAGEAELVSLGVLAGHRRQGCGRALLRAVVEWAEGRDVAVLFLEVGADNQAAQALYGEFGFALCGRRRGYYRSAGGRQADALIMRLPLGRNDVKI